MMTSTRIYTLLLPTVCFVIINAVGVIDIYQYYIHTRIKFDVLKQSQYLLTIGDQICVHYDRRIYYNVTCGTVTLNDTTKSIYIISYLHQNVTIDNMIVSVNSAPAHI